MITRPWFGWFGRCTRWTSGSTATGAVVVDQLHQFTDQGQADWSRQMAARALVAVVAVLALLTGCSKAGSAEPEGMVDQYVAALNDKNSKALGDRVDRGESAAGRQRSSRRSWTSWATASRYISAVLAMAPKWTASAPGSDWHPERCQPVLRRHSAASLERALTLWRRRPIRTVWVQAPSRATSSDRWGFPGSRRSCATPWVRPRPIDRLSTFGFGT